MSRFVWMLPLAALLFASGCESKSVDRPAGKVTSEDVRRDAGKAADTAAEFSQQAKEDFQKSLENRLQELEAELTKLREKGSELKDEAKVNWDKQLAELEVKRDAARVKLAEIGKSSAEAWKDVQQGAQAAWDDLDKAFREAAKEF